jgi:precorrin-2 dehydrogenase/sirohydrochlorin ferrochelatase
MSSLAANLMLNDREALLIGAGTVGRRKLLYLLDTGAKITVVEPLPQKWLLELEALKKITIRGEFSLSLLDNSPIVFIAVKEVEGSIIDAALKRGLWVNVAGEPNLGNFTLPALVEDGLFRLAVSTGGASPALSAKIARDLRVQYKGYGEFCSLLKSLRALILTSNLTDLERRAMFVKLSDSSLLVGLLSEGRKVEALELLSSIIKPLSLPEGFAL